MKINSDFNTRVVIKPEGYCWQASPVTGVERVMLDRIGAEVARATSIVRYTPNASFSKHTHEGGEEIFVLSGLFADECGQYPAGTYIRNPIASQHTPHAGVEGCLIFVKLHQFSIGDSKRTVIDTQNAQWRQGIVDGLQVLSLHQFESEHVALVRWAPNIQFQTHTHWGGEEILVIEGQLHDEHGCYPQGSWLRSPHLSVHTPFTKSEGALIYVKVGHLADICSV